jgi:hypothetical protein
MRQTALVALLLFTGTARPQDKPVLKAEPLSVVVGEFTLSLVSAEPYSRERGRLLIQFRTRNNSETKRHSLEPLITALQKATVTDDLGNDYEYRKSSGGRRIVDPGKTDFIGLTPEKPIDKAKWILVEFKAPDKKTAIKFKIYRQSWRLD